MCINISRRYFCDFVFYKKEFFSVRLVLLSLLTTTTWWLDWFALRSYINTCWRFTRWCWMSWWHTRLDLRCHGHKCLFDIRRILSRCFQEWNTQWIGIFLRNIEWMSTARCVRFHLLWLYYIQQLFSRLDHICFRLIACSRFRSHIDRFLEAIVWHCWTIP